MPSVVVSLVVNLLGQGDAHFPAKHPPPRDAHQTNQQKGDAQETRNEGNDLGSPRHLHPMDRIAPIPRCFGA